ncbi:hypothetical protein [Streptomyces rimosus]|uniref:hypothetical protein n=1 Tax=Streptomyces rimosus TaxID=1927 RepID=UPI00099BDE08|nr:hypothetical protein [Streptomyces rimosus]
MHDRASAEQIPQSSGPVPESAGPPGHRTTTVERGSFCLARCSCGWHGPARRARSQARTDAERHLATG